jgi:hypothetical protein
MHTRTVLQCRQSCNLQHASYVLYESLDEEQAQVARTALWQLQHFELADELARQHNVYL